MWVVWDFGDFRGFRVSVVRASDFDVQGSYGLWGLLGVLLFAQTDQGCL